MRSESGCFPGDFARIEEEIFPKPWRESDFGNEQGCLYQSFWDGDRCIAYAYVRIVVDEGELYRIAVLPQYRRQGLARKLLDALSKTARSMEVTTLHLEVSHLNTGAVAFYEGYGWQQTGLRKNYYGPGDHGLLMMFNLVLFQ